MKTDDSIFDHEALEKRKIASIIARGRKNKQQKLENIICTDISFIK